MLCACSVIIIHWFSVGKNGNRRWRRKNFVNSKKRNVVAEWRSSAYATWNGAPRSRSAKRPSWKRNANDGRPCCVAVKTAASDRRRSAATNADPSPLPLAALRRGCWSLSTAAQVIGVPGGNNVNEEKPIAKSIFSGMAHLHFSKLIIFLPLFSFSPSLAGFSFLTLGFQK